MYSLIKIYSLIVYLILTVAVLCIFGLPGYSITNSEETVLKHKAELICQIANHTCEIHFNRSTRVQAYTTRKNTIIVTKGLTDLLSYDEVEAVILHELGHHLLFHFTITDKFFEDHNFNASADELQKLKHQLETEADLFATSYYILHKKFNPLPNALIKITPDKVSFTSKTHPSTINRVNTILKFTEEFKSNEAYYHSSYSRKLYSKLNRP